MDWKKSLIVIIVLLAFAIEVQTINEFENRFNNSMLKTIYYIIN
jgi:hypothetical protein